MCATNVSPSTRYLALFILALMWGCGTADPPASDADSSSDAVSDTSSPDIDKKDLANFEPSTLPDDFLGSLHITETINALTGETRQARVMGNFYTSPAMNVMTRIEDRGACTLWMFQQIQCDKCRGSDRPCLSTGECWSYPTFLSVGTLELEGTKAGPLSMADNVSHFYGYLDITIKDFFDAGDPISLKASGGDVDAFELSAIGVGAIEIDNWDLKSGEDKIMHQITIPYGEDHTFRWVPHFSYDTIRLVLNGNNNCHGCPLEATIVCQSADTGSLTVPKELLAQMPPLQALFGGCPHSDCPQSSLARLREDFIQTEAGWIGLVVESITHFGVNHGP
jgi:hypothetical protein